MSELAVIECGEELGVASDLSGMSLSDLASGANSEYELSLVARMSFFEHAVKSGHRLLAAQAQVPWGEWDAWVEREFWGTPHTASDYMRFATYEGILRELGVTNQRDATRKLRELEVYRPHDTRNPVPESIKREARKLMKAGRSQREVARLYGVSGSTAWNWRNPERARARAAAPRPLRAFAAAALRREEQDKAARKIGGNVGKAYELVYALSTVLDAAEMAEGNPDAKATLKSALLSLYTVRDKINKAIGTSTPVKSK